LGGGSTRKRANERGPIYTSGLSQLPPAEGGIAISKGDPSPVKRPCLSSFLRSSFSGEESHPRRRLIYADTGNETPVSPEGEKMKRGTDQEKEERSCGARKKKPFLNLGPVSILTSISSARPTGRRGLTFPRGEKKRTRPGKLFIRNQGREKNNLLRFCHKGKSSIIFENPYRAS